MLHVTITLKLMLLHVTILLKELQWIYLVGHYYVCKIHTYIYASRPREKMIGAFLSNLQFLCYLLAKGSS